MNWGTLSRQVWGMTKVGVGAGIFYMILTLIVDSGVEGDKEDFSEEFEEKAHELTHEQTSYKLTGPNILLVIEPNTYTRYNFRDKTITLNGPDSADDVFFFSEYDQDAIENARLIGCQITEQAAGLKQEFLEQVEDKNEYLEKMIKRSETFDRLYCAPG